MNRLVKVTDEKHELFGKILPGSRIYYDLYHTGDSPDLFRVEHDGLSFRALSTQIDIEHYEAQLLAEEQAKLGAVIGDTVSIIKEGSGCFGRGWDRDVEHVITAIESTGHVEFDGGSSNGGASIFRPAVAVVPR